MRVLNPSVRRTTLLLCVGLLIAARGWAHPGSGIAVDKNGQVYFLDTGSGLWKIDVHGKLTKLDGTRFHWLALDEIDAFAKSPLPSVARSNWVISKVGSNPTVLLASDWPIAIDDKGNLYYPAGPRGSVQILRALPNGAPSVFATPPATAAGSPLPHLNGLAVGPDGSLYYTEDTAIRRIAPNGVISIVARVSRLAGAPLIPGIGLDSGPLLRALHVGPDGTIWVAAEGDGRVLRIAADGSVTTLMQSLSPWSPTAVAVHAGDVYVLEFLHTERDVRTDWMPRVRKLAADGRQTILATVDQMPGARASAPAPPKPVEDLRAVIQDSGACRLEWKTPALGAGVEASLGSVSHYRVERRRRSAAGSQPEWSVSPGTPTETNATIDGLERGLDYELRVVAINAGGSSPPSTVVTVRRP